VKQQSRRLVGNRRLCLIAPRRCVAGAIPESTPSVVLNRRVSERCGSPLRPQWGRTGPNRVLAERGNQFKANNGKFDFDLAQSPKEMAPTKGSWREDRLFTCGSPLSAALVSSLDRSSFAKAPRHSRYRQMPCERAESSAPDAASQSGSPRTIFVHPTPQGVAALSHRILHQLSWNRPSLHILVWRGFLFLDRRGVIKPCGYLLQATSFEIFHSGKMIWGEVGAFFSLACFGALVLFMVRREPEA
jgi:hypothetical protein